MKRRRLREAVERKDLRCEECSVMGVIAGDIFPYLVNAVPPVHRWMHAHCAEVFRLRRLADASRHHGKPDPICEVGEPGPHSAPGRGRKARKPAGSSEAA